MNLVQWLISIIAITLVMGSAISNRTYSTGPKIIGGSPIKIHEMPYLFGLYSGRTFQCGGVILSPIWAMSAYHCVDFDDEPLKTHNIRVGSSLALPVTPRYGIRKIYYYSSKMVPNENVPLHDIVLFRLRRPIRFTHNVRPAKLPKENGPPPNVLRVAGWGSTERTAPGDYHPGSFSLSAVNVSRVEDEECAALKVYGGLINKEWHLCYGDNKTDACYGDSGGPLGDSSTVYGIVSFGHGCAYYPGVYAKVSYYMRWIKHVTKL
ncbi:kallikrein-7-like [Venturia canescens]|uniref:kallikrein-7-like n=1 Tax=Venturia canescens TaxID=32260 RepID=UPI001C9CB767|nr:kallikrein-7-like [Venturia canescens]